MSLIVVKAGLAVLANTKARHRINLTVNNKHLRLHALRLYEHEAGHSNSANLSYA
jgi:hypothetical protein